MRWRGRLLGCWCAASRESRGAPFATEIFDTWLVLRRTLGAAPAPADLGPAGIDLAGRLCIRIHCRWKTLRVRSSRMPLDPIAYKPYDDPDDFIREVTDFIWVDRAIGFIRENYEPDSIVHTSLGTINGRDDVISGSLMRQAYGSNRIGQAEDVIWEARGTDAFLSSHLVFAAGSDLPYVSRTIANCLYRRGRMVEEWVVRDNLATALQQGLDPEALAAATPFVGYTGSMTQPPRADVLDEGDSGPRPDDYRPEAQMVLEFLDRVWNDAPTGEGARLLDPRPVPARCRPPHLDPAGGLQTVTAAVARAIPDGEIRGSRPADQLRRALRRTAHRRLVEAGR